MNIITRHNYEEFFILYMDNELSSDERRQVEVFVQQHPDLKDELDLLFQYKLTPDTDIVFPGKEVLMMQAATGITSDTFITLTNYEEWLVLYMDNELTAEQKTTVDQFLAVNPAAKKDFDLLLRTKLQPEETIFADKTSLYRTEEKVRPLPVRWWRIAAAAVLLLGIGITTAIVVNKKPGAPIAGGTKTDKKTSPAIPVITPKEPNTPVNENAVADNDNPVSPQIIKQTDNKNVAVKEKKNAVKNPLPTHMITPQPIKEEPVVVQTNKTTNELPQPLNNPNINKKDVANNAVANINPEEIKQKKPLTDPVVTTKDPQPSNIQYASSDATLDQPDEKKNKNRGFFRKIARTFEKRTSIDATDDNQLLVAGLAIRLK